MELVKSSKTPKGVGQSGVQDWPRPLILALKSRGTPELEGQQAAAPLHLSWLGLGQPHFPKQK